MNHREIIAQCVKLEAAIAQVKSAELSVPKVLMVPDAERALDDLNEHFAALGSQLKLALDFMQTAAIFDEEAA